MSVLKIIAIVCIIAFLIIKFVPNVCASVGLPIMSAAATIKNWTVYGTMSCGWTRKQIEYMDAKGIGYEFVDCTKNACEGMTGYPVSINNVSGERIEGFKEIPV